jgi:hypothetical protein
VGFEQLVQGLGMKWCFCLVFVLDTGDLSLDRYLTDKRLSTRWCRRHRYFQNTTWPLRCCEVQRNSVMRIIVSGNYEYNLMSGIVRLCSDDSWRLGKLRSVAFFVRLGRVFFRTFRIDWVFVRGHMLRWTDTSHAF